MTGVQAQGRIVQMGTNNHVHVINCPHNLASEKTSSCTQTSFRRPAVPVSNPAPATFKDMNGNDVELKPGDALWVECESDMANAVYIGSGVCACVRGTKVAKDRLYNKRFYKKKVQFKPRVDVFNEETACRRARDKLNECFIYGTSEDFVSWCYTGKVASEALSE